MLPAILKLEPSTKRQCCYVDILDRIPDWLELTPFDDSHSLT